MSGGYNNLHNLCTVCLDDNGSRSPKYKRSVLTMGNPNNVFALNVTLLVILNLHNMCLVLYLHNKKEKRSFLVHLMSDS